MTSLYDEARSATGAKTRPSKVDAIFSMLSDEDAADLAKAMLDESVSSRAIARVLTDRGHAVTLNPIHAYRADAAKRKFLEGLL